MSSCGRRYWYRITLKQAKQLHSVRVQVLNLSPGFLPREFEDEMKNACLRELKKKGYIPSVKDSPVYEFVLKMAVDSFNAGIRNYTKEYAGYVPDLSQHKIASSGIYAFRKPVKAIIFNCRLQMYKSKIAVWEKSDDLYFFNEYMKDLGRSDGMVRYLIRTAEPDK